MIYSGMRACTTEPRPPGHVTRLGFSERSISVLLRWLIEPYSQIRGLATTRQYCHVALYFPVHRNQTWFLCDYMRAIESLTERLRIFFFGVLKRIPPNTQTQRRKRV